MVCSKSIFRTVLSVFLLAATVSLATEPTDSRRPILIDAVPGRPLVTGLAAAARGELLSVEPGIVFTAPTAPGLAVTRGVILVPGLLAREQSMTSLLSAVEKHESTVGIFRYPTHEGIRSAATVLSEQLRLLRSTHPDAKFILVTHSMGGLVARWCLEDPTTNPGNVSRLIMIAPPNHGSAIAELSAAELAKRFSWLNAATAEGCDTVDAAVGSFVGAAKDELKPDSTLLRELNARSRAPKTRYSIIAGSGGPIATSLVNASFLIGNLFVSDQPEVKAALDSAREIVNIDEWTKGRGDGVVSIESTRLSGVSDLITLPFGHNDFGLRTTDAADRVNAEVIKRLND